MADDTAADVSDFKFFGLQKSRLFDPSSTPTYPSRQALTISSTYQIAVACCSSNSLVSFATSEVHKLVANKNNINAEYTGLTKKSVVLDVEQICAISMNCDGSLLAALVKTSAGVFVYVYDAVSFSHKYQGDVYHLCAIRIASDPATGLCIQWNPAIADTFAASASDNSLVTVKVDAKNPDKYSLVGNKRFGGQITNISWSPKGKQLTVGDSVGKISQLKPELDVVRSTLPLDLSADNVAVCGLCWLETTEWLVSFTSSGSPDISTYLLMIKKDQPPQWKSLSDLDYCNASSPLSRGLYIDCTLLVPWNLVLVSSARSSEVTVIGKREGSWKIWRLDDTDRLDLPTNSSYEETFPIGLAVDLSATEEVVLTDDGMKHKASPILFVLSTDGVLTAHHVITFNQAHADATIEPSAVDVSSVKIGKRPPVSTSPSNASISSQQQQPPPPQPQASTVPPKTLLTSTPSIGSNINIFTPSSTGQQKLYLGPEGSRTVLPPASPAVPLFSRPATEQAPTPPALTAPTADTSTPTSSAPVKTGEQVKPLAKPQVQDDHSLQQAVANANKVLVEIHTRWLNLTETLGTVDAGLRHAEKVTKEIGNMKLDELSIVMKDLTATQQEFHRAYSNLTEQLKDGISKASESAQAFERYHNPSDAAKAIRDAETFDRDQKMTRLVEYMDDVRKKYDNAQKVLENLRKFSGKKGNEALVTCMAEEAIVRQQVKVLERAVSNIKWKVQCLEDDMRKLTLNDRRKNVLNDGQSVLNRTICTNEVFVLKNEKLTDPQTDVAVARSKLRPLLQKKLHLKPVVTQSQSRPENLGKSVLNVSVDKTNNDDFEKWQKLRDSLADVLSPRKEESITSSGKKTSDAATQADTPAPAPPTPQKGVDLVPPNPLPIPTTRNSLFGPNQATSPAAPGTATQSGSGSFTTDLHPINHPGSIRDVSLFGPKAGGNANNEPKEESPAQFKSPAVSDSGHSGSVTIELHPINPPGSIRNIRLFGPKADENTTTEPKAIETPSAGALFDPKPTPTLFPKSSTSLFPSTEKIGQNKPYPTSPLAFPPKTSETSKSAHQIAPVKEEPSLPTSTSATSVLQKTQTSEEEAKSVSEEGVTVSASLTLPKSSALTPEKPQNDENASDALSSLLEGSVSIGTKENPTASPATTKSIFADSQNIAVTTPPSQPKSIFSGNTVSIESTPLFQKSPFGGFAPSSTSTPKDGSKSIFGGGAPTSTAGTTNEAPKSIFGGGAGVTAPSTEPKSIFGGGASASGAKSIFGGGAGATTTESKSIFGGGTTATQKSQSPFGGFNKPVAEPAKSPFSFKPLETAAQSETKSTFSFVSKPSGAASGFLAAAQKAASEEGMMEDDMGSSAAPAAKPAFSFNTGSNIFSQQTPQKTSIFGGGGGAQQSQSSIFGGAKPQAQSGFGSFNAAASQAAQTQQQKSIFGGSPSFGSSPAFGGGPKFGSSPFGGGASTGGGSVFGGAGFGGGQSPQQKSIFGGGGGGAGDKGAGFASFAGKGTTFASAAGSSIFGGGAQQSQAQQQQNKLPIAPRPALGQIDIQVDGAFTAFR